MDKEQRAAYGKEYREKNKDKIAEAGKEYREKNKDKIAEAGKEYREKNKDKIAEVKKEYYEKNKDKIAEVGKEYREKNKDKIKEYRILKTYNLTMEEYEEIYNRQNGCCPLCGKELNSVRVAIDHDHVTGKVRGIMCSVCNSQLGVYEKLNGVAKKIGAYLGNK